MNILILGRRRNFVEDCITVLANVLKIKSFVSQARITREGGTYIGLLSSDASIVFTSFSTPYDVALCEDLELAYLSQRFLKESGVIISLKKKPASKVGVSFEFNRRIYVIPARYIDPVVLLGGLSFLRILPIRREDFLQVLKYGDEKRISLFRFGERAIRPLIKRLI